METEFVRDRAYKAARTLAVEDAPLVVRIEYAWDELWKIEDYRNLMRPQLRRLMHEIEEHMPNMDTEAEPTEVRAQADRIYHFCMSAHWHGP